MSTPKYRAIAAADAPGLEYAGEDVIAREFSTLSEAEAYLRLNGGGWVEVYSEKKNCWLKIHRVWPIPGREPL